jgi:hypothetical protein
VISGSKDRIKKCRQAILHQLIARLLGVLFRSLLLLPAVLEVLQIHTALMLRMLDLGRGSSV